MKCPYCSYGESKVIDSRPTDDGTAIRRRRECMKCQKRFTTYEKLETLSLVVVKKDKSRQQYERDKVLKGLMHACEKRPISMEQMEKIVDEIEAELYQAMVREVDSSGIGELVMKHLKEIDEVAYVRFAAVYKRFDNIDAFLEELNGLKKDNKG